MSFINNPTFGELKAGDEFTYENIRYLKISGNLAGEAESDEVTEIPCDAVVTNVVEW